MKWGALVVTVWVLMGSVTGAIRRPAVLDAGHDAPDTHAAAAVSAATIVSGEEACWSDYVERAVQIAEGRRTDMPPSMLKAIGLA